MILEEPYNAWLIKNIGENIKETTRYVVKVDAVVAEGNMPVSVDLDLCWFILLHSTDNSKMKIEVISKLLDKPQFLAEFKKTFQIQAAKRLLAEYLLFNEEVLFALNKYMDFTALDVPLDFITHALLIKRSKDKDTVDIDIDRIKIVKTVLATDFKLAADSQSRIKSAACHKILTLTVSDERFVLTKRLLSLGYNLFSGVPGLDAEVATVLIDNRNNKDCADMINSHLERLKTLAISVAGSKGNNLADYYYWVREDMPTVEFIRKTLNIDIAR